MKERVEVPQDLAASVLFLANRTCCVCRERGKAIQIHHIDDDPSNNEVENLAVLCFDCHNDTQLRAGFGRKLDARQVSEYRNDWLARVKTRRDVADEIAASHQPANTLPVSTEPRDGLPDPRKVSNYIRTLPAIRRDTYARARELWSTGATSKMRQGNYDVIDVLEQILATLTGFYPVGQFEGQPSRGYMNETTALLFNWHRARLEPNGPGTGGRIVGPMVGGCVIDDLERMVIELVAPLAEQIEELDYFRWQKDWDAAAGSTVSDVIA